jgi:phospho-N-acetylmuramoyl-pentapeptide-transferase
LAVEVDLGGLLVGAGLSFLATLCAGPFVIAFLRRRFRERIVSDSERLNALHATKQGTPTMGGVLMAAGTSLGIVLSPEASLGWELRCAGVICVLSFALLGACDDYVKATCGRKGLTVRQKLFWQVVLGLGLGVYLVWMEGGVRADSAISIQQILPRVLWTALWIVSGSNAVNLTDGLDGLAAGCTAIAACALTSAIVLGGGMTGWGVIVASLGGSAVAFLCYNRHPAQVFMGDAGSLPLGALLGFCAVGAGRELAMGLAGVVFVAETLSVVLQVCWFRRTGRRVLLCSPLHNHFVFLGVSERRIVGLFWALGAAAGVVGLVFGV